MRPGVEVGGSVIVGTAVGACVAVALGKAVAVDVGVGATVLVGFEVGAGVDVDVDTKATGVAPVAAGLGRAGAKDRSAGIDADTTVAVFS